MMLIKIAWRNIWRSKKRSAIIIAAIIIGLWTGVFLIAFYNGMIEQRVRTAISQEISHIQIHHPEFTRDYDPKFTINSGYHYLDELKRDPSIQATTGRILLSGMISSSSGSSGIMINGINPDTENNVTGLKSKIKEGSYFNATKKNQIIISKRLIKKIKLNLSGKTILTFQDRDGNLASAAFKICGAYQTDNSPYDDRNVFVNISDVDSLANLKNELHEIAIVLSSNSLLTSTQENLKKRFPELSVQNWMEISPELGLTVSISDQMVFIYMGIILLALAFGIVNTMMMSVLERTRELGMLMALGMNKLRIFSMIILETLFLVMAGCPLGILFGLLTIQFTNKHGIQFEAYKEVYANFGYSDIIYPELSMNQFIIIITLVLLTAMISGIFPARKALRVKPVESIRK